jgi:hypothetical protein
VISVNGVERVLQAAAPLPTNAWSHVAVTFDGDTATLYVDASAKAIRADVAFDPYQVRAAYGLLGKGLDTSGFRGSIDSFRVYSKGLSSAEVLALVRLVRPGYVPEPGVDPPGSSQSEAIVLLRFAVHDASGVQVVNREAVTNGDLRNSAATKPAESASPGGMVSSGATYFTYNVDMEGLTDLRDADGFAMNTTSGGVSFADAGSPLELALRTNDTFSVLVRARRATDAGGFRLLAGRTSASDEQGAWSLGVGDGDRIMASMGGVDYDTGVVWALGAWHEVGLTYDGTGAGDGTVLVFVDGRRVGAFTPGAIDTSSFFNLATGLAGANIFRGFIDHVEFWDKTVTDATLAAYSSVPAGDRPGDYDGNDVVDGNDFLLWQRGLGSAAAPVGSGADGNRDGIVDAYDLGVWRANSGRVAAAGVEAAIAPAVIASTSGVDEPASVDPGSTNLIALAQAAGTAPAAGGRDATLVSRPATAGEAVRDAALTAAAPTRSALRATLRSGFDLDSSNDDETADAELVDAAVESVLVGALGGVWD